MSYFGTVQSDEFSSFFHILIAGIVLVTLLVTLDTAQPDTEGLGEYFALVCFGAVGMLLMTSAVELLLVFIGLEISSISTYIMAGFRRKSAKGPEAAIKYFLLGSFATAFFLYGIALIFGATGTTHIPEVAALLTSSPTPILATIGVAMVLIGLGFKVSAAPFQVRGHRMFMKARLLLSSGSCPRRQRLLRLPCSFASCMSPSLLCMITGNRCCGGWRRSR